MKYAQKKLENVYKYIPKNLHNVVICSILEYY